MASLASVLCSLTDPPPWTAGGPPVVFYPDPETGTREIVGCLDAVAGLLCAVVSTSPADKRGYHPAGVSDASGFAAMGIVEAVLHTFDILAAHDCDYAADAQIVTKVLDRLLPHAASTEDPLVDPLRETGLTPETRGLDWRLDFNGARTIRPLSVVVPCPASDLG